MPTDGELEALQVHWERAQATMRKICDAISAKDDRLAYTTVLSLLQVMEQKALVDHNRAGKAYLYFPKVRREQTFRSLAGCFLDRVFDGAVDEYLGHALDARGLTEAELD